MNNIFNTLIHIETNVLNQWIRYDQFNHCSSTESSCVEWLTGNCSMSSVNVSVGTCKFFVIWNTVTSLILYFCTSLKWHYLKLDVFVCENIHTVSHSLRIQIKSFYQSKMKCLLPGGWQSSASSMLQQFQYTCGCTFFTYSYTNINTLNRRSK